MVLRIVHGKVDEWQEHNRFFLFAYDILIDIGLFPFFEGNFQFIGCQIEQAVCYRRAGRKAKCDSLNY